MATIKVYVCECGEDVYEDDESCVNCERLVNQSKFNDEPLVQIVSETYPVCDRCGDTVYTGMTNHYCSKQVE